MTLPASGTITLAQVAGELGIGLPLSLGDSRVLALAGKSGLPISLSDLYGKSGQAPLSATAQDGYSSADSSFSGGTVTAAAQALPAGGSGSYSCTWTVVSNPSGASIGALNGQSVSISKTFSRLRVGSATVTFNVTVNDSQGHTTTVNGVNATVEWYSNQ